MDCKHHWLIESPNGPTSQGACKLCGERREFVNSGTSMAVEDRGFAAPWLDQSKYMSAMSTTSNTADEDGVSVAH